MITLDQHIEKVVDDIVSKEIYDIYNREDVKKMIREAYIEGIISGTLDSSLIDGLYDRWKNSKSFI